jgi:nucleoside-diphosphate-sugar epimerase
MKVFVAGATGAIGARAVTQLVAAGHSVTAIARSPAKVDFLRELGAAPVTVDMFDPDALRSAVAGHDVVCNLATHIPPVARAMRGDAWAENDKIRIQGSANLVDAAIAAGAKRYIQESISFGYADGGDSWLDESTPLLPTPLTASLEAAEANTARFTASGGVGVVLRFAMFYGAGSTFTVAMLRMVESGIAPSLGDPDGYQSMLQLDDAAAAVVAAFRAPAGVYNVAEDRPGTRRVQAAAMASALGVAPPWMPPAGAAKLTGTNGAHLRRSHRISNHAFRAATGWAPRYPDPWTGWAFVATPAAAAPHGRTVLVKASLAYLAIQAASLGLWATFFPHSWYSSFPGFGHAWVAASGPYDQHLVTDVGAFSLALLLVTLVAFGSRSRALMRTAGGAWVVSALPHFLFHLTHRGALGTGDYITSLSGLALQVVLGAVVLVFAPAARWPAPPQASVVPAPEAHLAQAS